MKTFHYLCSVERKDELSKGKGKTLEYNLRRGKTFFIKNREKLFICFNTCVEVRQAILNKHVQSKIKPFICHLSTFLYMCG